jgi:hypothetical protein
MHQDPSLFGSGPLDMNESSVRLVAAADAVSKDLEQARSGSSHAFDAIRRRTRALHL